MADTAESAAGAQHPTFSYDLKGNADLVLTDFASRSEGIYVPAVAPAGIYYIVDGNGFIAAEIQKPVGGDRQIALPAGRYHVRRRLADRLRIGEIQIVAGQLTALDESRLRDAPFSDDPGQGRRARRGRPREPRLGWCRAVVLRRADARQRSSRRPVCWRSSSSCAISSAAAGFGASISPAAARAARSTATARRCPSGSAS